MYEKTKSVETVELPNGLYSGSWGGYVVTITNTEHKGYEFKTNVGVRCMACPVTVMVIDGVATVNE